MYLVVARGKTQGRELKLEEGENLIGRWDPDTGAFPEIDLESDDLEAKVSRKHAVVICTRGDAAIEDVGSRNGTYLNRGPKLVVGERHRLTHGDEVIVGKTVLRFEIRPE
jgi:pSer/pThr/pTyr-binding forkhead associated (FHA) protein